MAAARAVRAVSHRSRRGCRRGCRSTADRRGRSDCSESRVSRGRSDGSGSVGSSANSGSSGSSSSGSGSGIGSTGSGSSGSGSSRLPGGRAWANDGAWVIMADVERALALAAVAFAGPRLGELRFAGPWVAGCFCGVLVGGVGRACGCRRAAVGSRWRSHRKGHRGAKLHHVPRASEAVMANHSSSAVRSPVYVTLGLGLAEAWPSHWKLGV